MKKVLAPSLWVENRYLHPRLIPTSPTEKGGSLSGQRAVGFLRDPLRQRWGAHLATFSDMYGLPSDFSGAREAEGIPDPLDRAEVVESALVASPIGIERIRAECRHFDGWVSRLEQLPPGGEG